MLDQELISVIVPVYNIEDYLPRCLSCLSSQTYKHLEIILVDDGSTDSSGRICDDFAAKDTRAKVIHQCNGGLWAARNSGQDAATGEYLFFPDGDDYFHHDIIRIMHEAINRDPQYDIAMVREKKVWDSGEDISSAVIPKLSCQTRSEVILGLLAQDNDRFYVYMWNKLYRRRLIDGIRSQNYSRSQDYDFNLRVFQHVSKAVLVNNDLYFWLQHPGSFTKAPDSVYMMLECRARLFYKNYQGLTGENEVYSPALLSRLYKTLAFWRGYSAKSNKRADVRLECREYERSTWKSYLSESNVSIIERLGCFILIHFPLLTRFLMRVTNNL